MLIKSLKAENFRKYHNLEVTDIPKRGVISIAGSNESGKTSIGEAICFALYGRTFFLDEKSLDKIICWGKDVAEVELEFEIDNGDTYKLKRTITRLGGLDVSLKRLSDEDSEEDQEKNTILGEERVKEALSKILGFNYDAFANSFYLVQRELTSPDPQSDAIKQMAGIGDYAKITTQLEASNVENKAKLDEITPEIETTQAALDEIGLDETWLPELVDAEQTLGAEQKDREELVGHLNDNEQLYAENSSTYHKARNRRGLFGFLSVLFLPLSLLLWLLWVATKFFPDKLEPIMSNLDAGIQSSLNQFSHTWLLPAAIASVVIYLISFILKKKANIQMANLDGEAATFASTLQNGHRYVTTQVETLLPERVVQQMYEKNKEKSTLLVIPPREQFTNLTQLVEDTPGYKAKPEELTAAVSRLTDALKKQDSDIVGLNNDLIKDIDIEKERSDKAGKLRSSLKTLQSVVNKCQYNIDVQNISIGMLQRAADDSITLFNNNIADISARTLPKFTEGRYSEIRIAEDLSVQVYSDEKKGYMDFDEISSGTQRQIMLALRMAMSEELSKNTGNEQQFIFLDEPFAFFDQARTKSTLKALPEVSDVITQVWIVAQEFPADAEIDKVINCPSEEAELLV